MKNEEKLKLLFSLINKSHATQNEKEEIYELLKSFDNKYLIRS